MIIWFPNLNMCEKRTRKVKKGSHISRLREARRIQRLQSLHRMTPSPASSANSNQGQLPQMLPIDKTIQNKVILELARKTVALMHKNRLIQQKIIALQKETSEFVANIMNNPENRLRYMAHMRAHANASVIAQDKTIENKENNNIMFKMENDAWMSDGIERQLMVK